MNVKNNTTKEVIRNLWLKRKEVTSTSGQDGIKGKHDVYTPIWNKRKTDKIYETTDCMTLDMKQQRTVMPER